MQEAVIEAMRFDIEEGNFCDTPTLIAGEDSSN
jgi:hypothetical protein